MPVPLIAQQGEEDLTAEDDAEHVDVDDPPPAALGDPLERPSRLDTCVVAYHVDSAEGGQRRRCEVLDRDPVGHVGHDPDGVSSRPLELVDRFVKRRLLDIGEDHLHALIGEPRS